MTIKLIITFYLCSFFCFSQKNEVAKLKIKRETKIDSVNIVGEWLRLFDTDDKGKKIKPTMVDTLFFFPDKSYMRFETGGKTKANWTLDLKKKRINLIAQKFEAYIEGNLIRDNFGDGSYNIDRVTTDTLVLKIYNETLDNQLYKKEYYKRIK